MAEPETRLRVVQAYRKKHPAPAQGSSGKKALAKFDMSQLRNELIKERLLIKDGVYEMMSELEFQEFMARPSKGGLTSSAASLKFRALLADPGAVYDEKGDVEGFKSRLSVKAKDIIIDRLSEGTRDIGILVGEQIKKPNMADINEAHRRLLSADLDAGGPDDEAATSAVARAQRLLHGTADLAEGGW